LVPGFFGFTSIGDLNYFYRVGDLLAERLEALGNRNIKIIQCRTKPTASIQRRAQALLDEVIASGGLQAKTIHFVGHSTGGLDVRLLVSPDIHLKEEQPEQIIGKKTKSVITLATPHHGTPLANFFTTLQGRRFLQLLAALAGNQPGRQAIFLGSRILSAVAKVDDLIGRQDTFLDHLAERFLRKMTLDPDDPVWQLLEDIGRDQGAIIQLTPEGMHLFNAAVRDRPGVAYSCVVTAVKSLPSIRILRQLVSPREAASGALFKLMNVITGQEHQHYPYPDIREDLYEHLKRSYRFSPDRRTNDGVSPTLSQLHGRLLHAVRSDHLDVVGQFADAGNAPFTDWMTSESGFNETRFRATWDAIAQQIQSILNSQ
jgi:hypothetical protein